LGQVLCLRLVCFRRSSVCPSYCGFQLACADHLGVYNGAFLSKNPETTPLAVTLLGRFAGVFVVSQTESDECKKNFKNVKFRHLLDARHEVFPLSRHRGGSRKQVFYLLQSKYEPFALADDV
jgi:hypothetical protein